MVLPDAHLYKRLTDYDICIVTILLAQSKEHLVINLDNIQISDYNVSPFYLILLTSHATIELFNASDNS